MTEYRDLADPADHDAVRDVLAQAFAFRVNPGQTVADVFAGYRDVVGRENFRCWRVGGVAVAGLCTYPMGQWFGGRAVPMHGVAAVGVAPEARGQGAGKSLMSALLHELYDRQVPLATLYASTQSLYRSVGFEVAGTWAQHEVDPTTLPVGDHRLPVTKVRPDSAALRQSHTDAACRQCGNVVRSEALWQRQLDNAYTYVIGTEEDPEGHVVFAEDRTGIAVGYSLEVRDLAANTPRALSRLWTFFADHRSLARVVRWPGPLVDWRTLSLPEHTARVAKTEPWMLRLVDVPAALQARGYHRHVVEELHLEVRDPVVTANHGRFVLSVNEGRGHVTTGGRGALVLDVRALAPLYSGRHSATQLARIGWIRADDRVIGSADRIFSGPEPWMPDRF